MSCEEVTFLGGEEGERGKWLLAYLAKEMTDGHCADGGRARATEIRLGFVFRKNAEQKRVRLRLWRRRQKSSLKSLIRIIHPPLFLRLL